MKLTLILASSLLGITSAVQFYELDCDGSEVETAGPLPYPYPPLSTYYEWRNLCSAFSGQYSAGCVCYQDGRMDCAEPSNPPRQECFDHCRCIVQEPAPSAPNSDTDQNSDTDSSVLDDSSTGSRDSSDPYYPPSDGSAPLDDGLDGLSDICSTTCTSVTRGCNGSGECRCTAPQVGFFFWFSGACASAVKIHGKRSEPTGISERSMNHTDRVANATSASSARIAAHNMAGLMSPYYSNETIAALQQGEYPAPCNESYVSFACANSTDGIVHESPDKWLGALLPANSSQLPVVPPKWLAMRGLPANHTAHNGWLRQ